MTIRVQLAKGGIATIDGYTGCTACGARLYPNLPGYDDAYYGEGCPECFVGDRVSGIEWQVADWVKRVPVREYRPTVEVDIDGDLVVRSGDKKTTFEAGDWVGYHETKS